MEVSLIQCTKDPLQVIFLAARRCYSSDQQWNPAELPTHEKQEALVKKVVASGHTSVLEHVQYTFSISGVSRALSHQLVRHRHASFSQQSQRYVPLDDVDATCVVPPLIRADTMAYHEFSHAVAYLVSAYHELRNKYNIPAEDARYLLPNAMTTSLVMTMNARELYETFFPLRLCTRAQWEIRHLAERILDLCRATLPEVFNSAGPRCETLGFCLEEHGCGKYPKKSQKPL